MATRTYTLEIVAANAAAAARVLADPRALEGLYKVLAVSAVAAVKDNFAKGRSPAGVAWAPLSFPRPAGGTLPLRDKGLLMASIAGRAEKDGVIVGTTHPGAALHQHGGVVRAKSGKALALPLTAEAARIDGPRAFPRPLHVRRRKGSESAVLADAKGKPQYALVKKVAVPARPFLGFSQEALADMAATAGLYVTKKAAEALAGG